MTDAPFDVVWKPGMNVKDIIVAFLKGRYDGLCGDE